MKQTSDIDALFKTPLADFTQARNALASRLKKEGRAAEAEEVKAMAKPAPTAWAVNQLFWRDPKAIERLLAIADKVREAQTRGATDLRLAVEERRTVISNLTERAAQILRDAGHADSQDAKRRMATTFESLGAFGRANVATQVGRLTSDLQPLGFDGLAALLDGKKLEPAKVLQFRRAAAEKKTVEDDAAARARASEAVKTAEKALTATRRDAARAEAAAAKATARAKSIEDEKRKIDARHDAAREEARAAASEAKKAAHTVTEAERALARARAAFESK